jgi:tetratricopeptide (TPR) repeat protein
VALLFSIKFRILSAEFGSSIVVFSLITAILALAMVGRQEFTGGENGALAKLVPGVEELQKKLGIIETKIDAVKRDTEALRKARDEDKARAEQRQTELKSLVMDAAGGGATAVRAVAEIRDLLRPGNPEIDGIPAEKLPSLVKRIIEDLQKPAAKPEDFSGTVKRVLTEAQARAEELKFVDAAKVLDAALARTEAEDKDRARGHAALLAERGRIARLQLRYPDAAAFYAKAAEAAASDPAVAWRHTLDSAYALYAQGGEFGDNQALLDAIRVYRSALDMAPPARAPLDWAKTQNNLGAALETLGKRESGTERLEEAVAADREALQEFTRTRAPLDWAKTQNNLGIALGTLGKRDGGTARLEEAVAAYREALQEQTRAGAPLDWAMTQNNLGNALAALGARESGTARLEEAAAAFREALQELTRARVPLLWAGTQMNLGNALRVLGKREGGTARLTEAAAFREALQELTRARVPLQWATTQMNLGNALRILGERESGTAWLEEAVSAYREALQENTRARVPLEWAKSTGSQGVALMLLAERRGDAKMAKLAIQQIEAAFTTSRDGGDAPSAALYEAQLLKARALAGKLGKR